MFRIAEWVSKQAEREREKEKQKQERLARRRAMPKHTFDDQSYTQHIQQNSERIEDALHQGKILSLGVIIVTQKTDLSCKISEGHLSFFDMGVPAEKILLQSI